LFENQKLFFYSLQPFETIGCQNNIYFKYSFVKKIFISLIFFAELTACEQKNVEPSGAPGPPYFAKVKAIISTNCLACHSSSGSWSGKPVEFDTDAQIVASATTIKTAVAGPWTLTIKKMPQGGVLSQSDIDTIVAWVDAGGQANN
jgi:uncharacterized membrane protein